MMEKIKKFFIIFFVFIVGLVLASCGNGKSASLIISGDYKTSYYLNEEFSAEGLVVKYIVGKKEVVTDYIAALIHRSRNMQSYRFLQRNIDNIFRYYSFRSSDNHSTHCL